jgi:SAM-dependent methyltransferase
VDGPLLPQEAKLLVRRGYDQISHAYRDDVGAAKTGYGRWLSTHLLPRLPAHAAVLDLGCGNGVPATRILAEHFEVTGVDISEVQIARARTLVPNATFLRADIADVAFTPASFHAVVSFFALIHVPVAEQPAILHRVGEWLKPGGLFVATVGHEALTRIGDFYGAPMYWSHADVSTYCTWLDEACFEVVETEFLPEDPHGGHELVVARRRGGELGAAVMSNR